MLPPISLYCTSYFTCIEKKKMGRAASICGIPGIRRFELVARRLAGYAVAMEVARRPEGPEVNGNVRKTVSRRSLVPS